METKEILNKAVDVLRSGGLLLYPTDTVWGLGCDATDPEAVAKIFALKKREDSKSLVLLGYRRNQDSDDGFLCGSRQAFRLSDSFDFGEYLRRTYTEEFPGNIAGHQGWSGLYSGPCTGKYIHRQVIVHHQGRSGRYHRDHQKIAAE